MISCNEEDYNECDNFYFDVVIEDDCENIICYCKLTLEPCSLWER